MTASACQAEESFQKKDTEEPGNRREEEVPEPVRLRSRGDEKKVGSSEEPVRESDVGDDEGKYPEEREPRLTSVARTRLREAGRDRSRSLRIVVPEVR